MLVSNNTTPHHTTPHTLFFFLYYRFLFYSYHIISYHTTLHNASITFFYFEVEIIHSCHTMPFHTTYDIIYFLDHTHTHTSSSHRTTAASIFPTFVVQVESFISSFLKSVVWWWYPVVFSSSSFFIAYVVHTWLVWNFELLELTSPDLEWNEIR